MLIALVALVAAGAVFNALPEAQSPSKQANFTSGWCTDEGVSLHIETSARSSTKCALSFDGTGWDVFAATDTKVQGTAQYPTGFVCRINNMPAEQDCKYMPRFNEGSWAYFYAEPGDEMWRFSPVGSATRKPRCGGAEAWVFAKDSTSTTPLSAPQTFVCK